MSAADLITPELLARLRRHSLPLRRPATGASYGVHAGRQLGSGVAFNEYRLYAAGDDPKRVDWKVVARSDRYYVREAERDSTTPVWLLLDDSASMDECGEKQISKRRWSAAFLAGIAAMAIRQGDAVGAAALSSLLSLRLPQRGQRQLSALCQLLRERSVDLATRLGANSTTDAAQLALPDARATTALTQRMRSAALVIFVSDFLDARARDWLSVLHAQHHDVLAVCASTTRERALDWPDPIWLHGREGEAPRLIPVARLRPGYMQQREEHFSALHRFCRQRGVQWLDVDPDQGVETSVLQMLALRRGGVPR